MRFGNLTVLNRAPKGKRHHSMWLCKCDCNAETVVDTSSLRSGNTKSCGCITRKLLKESSTKHGKHGTRLYRIWKGMVSRCNCKGQSSYKHYGGRGISVCSEWLNYESFDKWALENGYSDNLTIDRIDTDGNYTPKNCRWVTMEVQAKNKRNSRTL